MTKNVALYKYQTRNQTHMAYSPVISDGRCDTSMHVS